MAAPTSLVVPDPTKLVFNPPNSVKFAPVEKKQGVKMEITNNSTLVVAVKFKNSDPFLYKAYPPSAKIGVGEKKTFILQFKGASKHNCKANARFSAVCVAIPKNEDNVEKAFRSAPKTAIMRHLIQILFEGINDEPEDEKAPEDP
ncbi:unnamed protein product [Caenorhabditis brenneri]